ncbi:MAG: NAD(P)H-binding protein [Solirubrobacterales bacterium]
MILVTGATGNVGRELVGLLAGAGRPVRALIRREADRAKLAPGAEAVIGDLNRAETLAEAVDGVTAIHLLAGYDGLEEMLAAARGAGVERVVLQSSSAAPTGDLSNAVARYHILSERAIRDSGLGWTFLQPNSFMSNALRWLPQLRAGDVVTLPFADVPIATVDPHDVAEVSAAALTTSDHAGRSYRLSGPESLAPAEQVRILGRAIGRELRFEPESNEGARARMTAEMPREYVDAFFEFFVDGTVDESTVLPTVAEVLGRPPGTFEDWALAHADAFR